MEEIIITGVPRSATTLVFNIIREVGYKANKTHAFIIPSGKVIVCIRDFRDCFCSLFTAKAGGEYKKIGLFKTISGVMWIKRYIRIMRRYDKEKKGLLWLRYEDFDWFNEIERYLGCKIKNKKALIKKYDLNNIKAELNKHKSNYPAFKSGDGLTRFHTFHINKGEVMQWKKIVPKRYWRILYYFLRRDLLDFGYASNLDISMKRKLDLFKSGGLNDRKD